jgi:hypothetical protein
VNSPEAEEFIQNYVRQPMEPKEVARYWKGIPVFRASGCSNILSVYTTTSRRLRDPTAERLENYWYESHMRKIGLYGSIV